MAQPLLLQGQLIQIFLGDGATPVELFTFLCIASSKSLKREQQTEDHFEVDCASPDNLPTNVSYVKSHSWSLSVSGRVDAKKLQALEAWLDGNPHNVQFKVSKTGANGGGIYQGAIILMNLNYDTSDNGIATFSAEMKGQGAYPTFTAAA